MIIEVLQYIKHFITELVARHIRIKEHSHIQIILIRVVTI